LHYLAHTEKGESIRAIARASGYHASTVLRQIRACETLRDDFLFDHALRRLGMRVASRAAGSSKKESPMNAQPRRPIKPVKTLTEEALTAEACRVLPRLSESGAVLAVAQGMEKAIVIRKMADDDREVRTAVVDTEVAEAMALKAWIACDSPGRVSRYQITREGRAALNKMLAQRENYALGFSEDQAAFVSQFQSAEQDVSKHPTGRKRVRYGATETPVMALARRKDRDGQPFLSDGLVRAGERLREDFELAHLRDEACVSVEDILTLQPDDFASRGRAGNAAHGRVVNALRELGPGLSDVVLRCCCCLEGLEKAEKRMGWSARSGKIVLRIALQRLRRHYDSLGDKSGLMG
jgi:hypothetical protein